MAFQNAPEPEPVAAETAEAFPPLTALLAQVKSPGMVRADIDALIAAMGRAPTADESLRERADLLLGLMSRDNPVGKYRGENWTTVRQAAKAALLALGYPYALELPPDMVESYPSAPPVDDSTRPGPGPGAGSVVVTLLSSLYQTGLFSLVATFTGARRIDWDSPLEQSLILGMVGVWLPALCSFLGHTLGKRWLQVIGAVGLWLLFAGWGLASLAGTASLGPGSLLLLPWHLALWAAIVMRPVPEKTETGEAAPTDPQAPTPES
ncbi:hypothetical protein D7V97_01085 [Corallococcus sp. CA053C]|uniref:hypothetical protein n=1 Tax=Corallococcus sp. CA053C TaxID=2316732 RepID=UPI000EA0724D|nr:hypothetical protein [Corallococcus sp. CA053C]RKH15045.1 hypothetical protein D7V97_01085 [Corallococcus sp. CA053C]